MARVRYLVDPEPLPACDDIVALASTWKRVYNTEHGKGDPKHFVRLYEEFGKE